MLYCSLIVFIYYLTHTCCTAGMNYVAHPVKSEGVMKANEDKVYPIMGLPSYAIQRKSQSKGKKTYRASNVVPLSSPPPSLSPMDVPMKLIQGLLDSVQLANKENNIQNVGEIINVMQTKLEDFKAKYAPQPVARVVDTVTTTTQAPPKDTLNEMDKLMKDFLRAAGSSSGSAEPVMRGEDKEDDSGDLNYELDEDLKLSLSP